MLYNIGIMKKIYSLIFSAVLIIVVIVLYILKQPVTIINVPINSGTIENNNPQKTEIVNPASEFCIKSGGQLVKVVSGAGEGANCVFSSGKVCEEWALFRGECKVSDMSTSSDFVATETYKGQNSQGEEVIFEHKDFTSYKLTIGATITEGKLNTERGWKNDSDATVFILNWQDNTEKQIAFVKKTGVNTVVQLDTQRTEITPVVKLVLSK